MVLVLLRDREITAVAATRFAQTTLRVRAHAPTVEAKRDIAWWKRKPPTTFPIVTCRFVRPVPTKQEKVVPERLVWQTGQSMLDSPLTNAFLLATTDVQFDERVDDIRFQRKTSRRATHLTGSTEQHHVEQIIELALAFNKSISNWCHATFFSSSASFAVGTVFSTSDPSNDVSASGPAMSPSKYSGWTEQTYIFSVGVKPLKDEAAAMV